MKTQTPAKATPAATQQTPAQATTPAAPQQEKPAPKLQVLKKDAQFRGARKEWYAVLVAHDGKPAEEFLKATKDKPPSLPKKGTPEPPMGWLRFFIRAGICKVA